MAQRTRPQWPRRFAALASLAFAFALMTCDQQAAGPGRHAALAVEAALPTSADLAAFNLVIDSIRLIVVRPATDTVFDQTYPFGAGQDSLQLSADVPLEQSPETFQVTIEMLSGATLLFSGTQDVALTSGQSNAPAQIPVTYSGPGQDVATLTIDPPDSVLSFGGVLTFRPTARDGQGNEVTSFYLSWTTSDTAIAKIDVTGRLVAPTLRASAIVTARTPATASQPNGVTASTPITFVPTPTAVSVVSGCPQSGAPGLQLPQPFVVQVNAADNQGVRGVKVGFAATSGGGSVSPASDTTDALGRTQALLTLGAGGGANVFQASAAGVATPATCNATAVVATQLAFTVQPASAVVGVALATIEVELRDGAGALVPTATNPVTLALGANPGNANLLGTVTVDPVGGRATFSNLIVDAVGNGYTLVASSGGLASATSASFNVTPVPGLHLAFTQQPGTTIAGDVISPPVEVTGLDAQNNPVPSFSDSVTLSFGSCAVGATLSGTTTVKAATGVATFSDLRIDKAGGCTLVASSPGLQNVASASFTIAAGPAARLAFSVEPSNVVAGVVMSPAVRVAIEDSLGNLVSSATDNVTLTISVNPGNATLGGTTTRAAASGVAIFTDLTLDKAGQGYTLEARSGSLQLAASAPFDVTVGPVTQLVITTEPTSTTAGTAIAPAVVVEARDAQGNTVPTFTGQVTVALQNNPGQATLTGTLLQTAVGGVATFDDLSLDKAASGYTLLATSGNLSTTSTSFAITAGAPAQIAFIAQPTDVLQGATISPPVVVAVQDQFGNTVPNAGNSITLTIGANPGNGTLSGTTSAAASGGLASFADLSIGNPGTGYTLRASTPGFSDAFSAPFNVLSSGAGIAWINPAGGNWNVASNWSPARVPAKTDTVFITLAGTYTVTLNVNDTVAFLTFGGATGAQTLVATNRTFGIDSGATLLANATLSLTSTTLNGGGALSNGGTIAVAPGTSAITAAVAVNVGGLLRLNGNNGPASVTVNGGFSNAGTIELTGTSWGGQLAVSGTLTNAVGATLRALNGANHSYTGVLNNQGTVQVDGPLTLNGASADHVNSGTITLGTGNLTLNQSGTTPSFTTTGSVVVGAGRTWTVSGGALDYVGGTIEGNGTVALSGVTVGLGVSLTHDTLLVSLTNATVNGPGTLTVAGASTLVAIGSTINAPLVNQGILQANPGTNVFNGTVANQSTGLLRLLGNNGPAVVTVGAGFTNAGAIELTGTSWGGQMTVSGTLTNAVGATLRALNGANHSYTGALDNQGTVQVDGPLTLNGASADYVNSGTITLGTGNLTLNQSGTTPSFTTTGSVVVGAGRVLQVNGGAFNYANASPGGLAGLGTVSFSGVTLALTPDLTHDTLQVSLTNSTVNGPGTLRVSGAVPLTLTATTLNAALDNQGIVQANPGTNVFNGTVANQSTGLLRLLGNNGPAMVTVGAGFTNAGTIELTGTSWGGQLAVSGTLTNAVGATLRALNGANHSYTGALDNQGTLQVDGPLTMNGVSADHQNSGTITLGAGSLTLTQSGTTPSFTTTGTVAVGAGRTWTVNGGAVDYAGGAIGGNGMMVLSGVTLGLAVTLTHDTLPVSLGVSLANSTVNGPGTLPVAGTSTLTLTGTTVNAPLVNFGTVQAAPGTNVLNGAVTNVSGALLRLNGNNGFADMTVASGFTNAGTIELTGTSWAGRLTVGSPTIATLVNGVGATLQATGGSGNVLAAVLDNQGTVLVGGPLTLNAASAGHGNSGLIKLAGGDLTVVESGTRPGIGNTGVIDVGTNKMIVSGTGSFINQSAGTLQGSGTFDIGANISFITNGTTIVGSSPGILNWVGTYTQGPDPSVLSVEIGGDPLKPGVDFDQMQVSDNVTLQGGTLDVTQLGPVTKQTYVIMQVPAGKTITGDFQTKIGLGLCSSGVSGTAYVIVCP